MDTSHAPSASPATAPDLRITQVLAQLLERLDRSSVGVSADQYRLVVQHLSQHFTNLEPGPELNILLATYPAAAELYENLNYQHAGLCRSPLEASLAAELQAKQAIEHAQADSKHNSAYGKS